MSVAIDLSGNITLGDAVNTGLLTLDGTGLTIPNGVTLSGNTALTVLSSVTINDVIGDGGNNFLRGNAGADFLRGNAGADTLDGGLGSDTADYFNASVALVADLLNSANSTGDAAGDTYISIENLSGSQYDDILIGNAANNVI